jgi:anti-anti-sigma factor
LSVQPDLTAGTATIVISGELDLLSAPSLAEHLDQILGGQPRRLVFDLARVSFIDCAAARLIAGTEASLPDDHRPVVRRAAPEVRRVFELTGLDIRCEMDGETG